MPYLNVRTSIPESSESAEKIVAVLMKYTSEVLGKKPDVTSIEIDFIAPKKWFVGGVPVSDQKAVTFYLDIKIRPLAKVMDTATIDYKDRRSGSASI